jgi:hypothetical protein|tara:strand:+ start:1792 stop:2154 length:363 start_codon:yes stop_codon:yes gene_type:complete
MTDRIKTIHDKIKFADTKTNKVMIVCERQLKYTPSKTVVEIQKNGADSIGTYEVTEWYHSQPQSEMIEEGDDEEYVSGIEEWKAAVSEKFNVIEMYNEDAECEAELDDGEFTTVKINEVL